MFPPLRCRWCESTELEPADVVGAPRGESWFRCIYCRCFVSTRQKLTLPPVITHMSEWRRRLMLMAERN